MTRRVVLTVVALALLSGCSQPPQPAPTQTLSPTGGTSAPTVDMPADVTPVDALPDYLDPPSGEALARDVQGSVGGMVPAAATLVATFDSRRPQVTKSVQLPSAGKLIVVMANSSADVRDGRQVSFSVTHRGEEILGGGSQASADSDRTGAFLYTQSQELPKYDDPVEIRISADNDVTYAIAVFLDPTPTFSPTVKTL